VSRLDDFTTHVGRSSSVKVFQPMFTRIGARMRQLNPDLPFDFHDVFFAVATWEGSSNVIHTDWGDCRRGGMSFVVTLTSWTGGGVLQVPQLKVSVCPVPGDVTAVQAGRLLHKTTTPKSGRRVVLTLFTDNALFADRFSKDWKTWTGMAAVLRQAKLDGILGYDY
jgi:hypothetical protein